MKCDMCGAEQRSYIENENKILVQLLFQEENIKRTKEY